MEYLIFIIFFCLACGLLGSCIGRIGEKANEGIGFLLGFLLGPIGLLITVLLPANSEAAMTSLTTTQKIAKLEGQLKELRKQARREADEIAGAPVNDVDTGVATYKLD